MSDQELVNAFLKEFTQRLVEKYGKQIDFILLFGSAARGEWKRGVSDVDLIIQVKDRNYVKEIREFAKMLFWELDEKYGTKFREVCSIAHEDVASKLLSKARLYVPFEVMAPGDIDWRNCEIKRKDLVIGAKIVAPQVLLFLKMKKEGKILYGRDIRKEIKIKNTLWEKFKAILVPFYLSLISCVISIINPRLAIKLADKATIYSLESTLFFLDMPVGKGTAKALEALKKKLRKQVKAKYNIFKSLELDLIVNFDYTKFIDLDFAKRAITVKYEFEKIKTNITRVMALKFSFKAFKFVNSLLIFAIITNAKTRKYLEAAVIIAFVIFSFLILLLLPKVLGYLSKFF